MKRIFLFVALSFFMISAKSQKIDRSQLEQFINSKEFDQFSTNSAFAFYGDLQFDKITTQKIINPITKKENLSYLIPIQENGKIKGAIQYLKVREGSNIYLPNQSDYLMTFRDYTDYDFNTKTGEIRVYDINYDEYLAAVFTVNKGTIINFISLPMPETIKLKYKEIAVGKNHPCDLNGNGNVSWGECYACMKNACASDPDCLGLCEVIDIFGGQCSGSIGAACAVLSVIY